MKLRLYIFLIAVLLVGSYASKAQELSPRSSVSLLTCGSGNDLYSIFGHTAIRVRDTANRFDIVYNYGTFHFSDDFYVKFVMGKLNYRLSIQDYDRFEMGYRYENRWVDEQVLNLNYEDRLAVFNFLQNNYLPENREYLYDFFYDNCSTRPRDVFETVLGDRLTYSWNETTQDSTFKDMLNVYLDNMQWSDAGMDLGLGMPADKVVSEREKLFLPNYLLRAYANASVESQGTTKPLVLSHKRVVDSIPITPPFDWSQPLVVFWGVFLVWLLLGISPFKKVLPVLDLLLYTVVGLAGWIIVFLWFVTDHTTTQVNFDALWALPIYLPLGWLCVVKNKPAWLKRFFGLAALLCALVILSWPFLPQDLNAVYIPIILTLCWRGIQYSGLNVRQLLAKTA